MTYSSGILIILFICRSPFGKLEFVQSRFGLTRNIILLYSTAFFFFLIFQIFFLTKFPMQKKKKKKNTKRNCDK
jgi:hypothetical protein